MFIFFSIKEHPSHDEIEQCLDKKIACEDAGVDAYNLVMGYGEGVADNGAGVEEEDERRQQTGLEHEKELEMKLALIVFIVVSNAINLIYSI